MSLSHIVIPVLGIAAFVPAWCAGAGSRSPECSWIAPLPAPLSYMGPAVAIWMVIGVVYLIYLYAATRSGSSTSAWSTSTPSSIPPPR